VFPSLGGRRYSPFEEEILKGIAAAHGKSIAQVVLRRNVQRGITMTTKSTHQQRIEENFNIWDFSLSNEEVEKITSLDMAYAGDVVKHFDPQFVRGCLSAKIHD